jgi:DNA-binding NtrC family response regulator
LDRQTSPQRQLGPDGPVLLLVEDNFATRWMAAAYLREAGFQVLEAESAAEAIGVLSSGIPIDLVFSDVWMPGEINGHEFAWWMAKHHPTVPVLLTSGEPQEVNTIAVGKGRRFVTKPYDLSEVVQHLQAML